MNTIPKDIQGALDQAPPAAREGMLALRDLIFQVASETPGAIPVTETLKWNQPSYTAPKGTALRLGVPKSGAFALFVHCQSKVIPAFREMVGDEFRYEKNRAVLFDTVSDIKSELLTSMIFHALTYHTKN